MGDRWVSWGWFWVGWEGKGREEGKGGVGESTWREEILRLVGSVWCGDMDEEQCGEDCGAEPGCGCEEEAEDLVDLRSG